MANKQGVALDAFCGPNCDLCIASVTIAMHAKVYVITDRPITTPHCICSNIWPVCFQMLLYGEARGSSVSATELRVFCADAYGSEYIFITQIIMGPVRSS